MGIARPADPYGLTESPAWPDVDEDILRACGNSFVTVSNTVDKQADSAKQEQARIFGGIGIWAGQGASAAGSSLDTRIADLQAVVGNLNTAANLFSDAVAAVVRAKTEIINNVEVANNILDWVKNHPDIPDSAKEAAVAAGVNAVRSENIAIVVTASSQLSGKSAAQPMTSPTAEGQTEFSEAPRSGTPSVPISNWRGLEPATDVVQVTSPGDPELRPHMPTHNQRRLEGEWRDPVDGTHPAVAPSRPPFQHVNFREPEGSTTISVSPPLNSETLGAPSAHVTPGSSGLAGIPGTSAPGSPSAPRISAPASPLSGTTGPSVSAPSTPGTSSTANPAAAAANQAQISEFQRSMVDAAAKTAAQTPIPPPQATPSSMGAAPAAQPLAAPPVPDAPTSTTTPTPPPAPTSPAGASAGVTAPAPVTPAPGSGAAPGGAVPLGPPPTPPPAAPATPATAGPSVAPAAAAAGSSTVGAPAPVPVSAARAQREAIAAATLRRPSATDPVQVAHRIAAALNVGINDIGFFWITGLAKDGTIVVANNYGLGYIPEGVNLPDPVKMASADESIPATIRGTWATYPILALHGWAQHHNTELRAVIATEDQFKGFDPGAPKIVLRPDDIPQSGEMKGRRRLQVIAADAATRLAAISGGGLSDVLPPAPTDTEAPQDQRAELWFEVFRPLLSNAPDRGQVQLAAFVTYAEHAQELALHDAHIATDEASQRAAIADWIYWQHLSVLSADAIAASASV